MTNSTRFKRKDGTEFTGEWYWSEVIFDKRVTIGPYDDFHDAFDGALTCGNDEGDE